MGALASTMLLTMQLFVCQCVKVAKSSWRNCILTPLGGRCSVMNMSSGHFGAVAFAGSIINFLVKAPSGD